MIRIFSLVLYYLFFEKLPSRSFGRYGVWCRRVVCKFIFAKMGSNVNIASGVRFGKGHLLSIGDNSGIGENGYIVCMDRVDIGRDVMIGPEVMLLTGGHSYLDPTVRLIDQPITRAPIKIDDDVWIGARVLVLPGVVIGKRSIVAAGSVVTKNIPPNSIFGGNPARFIRHLPT